MWFVADFLEKLDIDSSDIIIIIIIIITTTTTTTTIVIFALGSKDPEG